MKYVSYVALACFLAGLAVGLAIGVTIGVAQSARHITINH